MRMHLQFAQPHLNFKIAYKCESHKKQNRQYDPLDIAFQISDIPREQRGDGKDQVKLRCQELPDGLM